MNFLENFRNNSSYPATLDLEHLKDEFDNYSNNLNKNIKSSLLIFSSLKLLHFLNYSIFFLAKKIPKTNSDIEENLLVQIEIDVQLLTSQISRVINASENDKQYQESVLNNLVEKHYSNAITLFSRLEMVVCKSKSIELSKEVKSLLTYLLNEIPVVVSVKLDANNHILSRIDL